MISITGAHVKRYAIDLPKAVSSARGTPKRVGWHLLLTTERRDTLIGDIATWQGFGPSEDEIRIGCDRIINAINGASFADVADLEAFLHSHAVTGPVAYGVETAVIEGLARRRGQSLISFLSTDTTDRLPVHELIYDERDLLNDEHRTISALKMKVGGDVQADLNRVSGVYRRRPDVPIRIDANGKWGREESIRFLDGVPSEASIIFEQPVLRSDLEGFTWLKSRRDSYLAADESVYAAGCDIARIGGVDEVVLKPMFIGGLVPARRMALSALSDGLSICITHALESEVGRYATKCLAAGLPNSGIHGLLFGEERPVDGAIVLAQDGMEDIAS